MAVDITMLTQSLIGRMEIQRFNREVRERRAERFEAAIHLDQLKQLYDLSKLELLLNSDEVPIPYIDIFHSDHLMRLGDVQKKSGRSCLEVVVDNFRQGSTIRVRDLDKCDAQLNQFIADVQRYFAARSQVNLYLTPPGKEGFPAHFDITDVFIIQCIGKKEWRIFRDYSNMVELPTMETNWDPNLFKPSVSAEVMTLRAGDVLYLPRGVMHEAFCQDRESMHLTISIVPLTFADLITKALSSTCKADIEFRRRVPWSIEDEEEVDELTKQAKQCIAKLADQLDVSSLLDTERRLLQGEPRGSSSGALKSAIASLLETAASGRRSNDGQQLDNTSMAIPED